MRMRLAAALLIAISGSVGSAAFAEPAPKPASSTVIAPILGQLVSFTLPAGFVMQKEQSNTMQYFHGGFLKGETADTWTQMIAVTAGKNMDPDPKKTAQFIAANIANDIHKHRPDTFSVKPLGPSNRPRPRSRATCTPAARPAPRSWRRERTPTRYRTRG